MDKTTGTGMDTISEHFESGEAMMGVQSSPEAVRSETGANAMVVTDAVDIGSMIDETMMAIEVEELSERISAQSSFLAEELNPMIAARLKEGRVSSKELSSLINAAIMAKDPSWQTWGIPSGQAELIRATVLDYPCYVKFVNEKQPKKYKSEDGLPYYPVELGESDMMTVAVTKQGQISIQLSPIDWNEI